MCVDLGVLWALEPSTNPTLYHSTLSPDKVGTERESVDEWMTTCLKGREIERGKRVGLYCWHGQSCWLRQQDLHVVGNKMKILFYVLFLRIGAHCLLQSKEQIIKTLSNETNWNACAHTNMHACVDACALTHTVSRIAWSGMSSEVSRKMRVWLLA